MSGWIPSQWSPTEESERAASAVVLDWVLIDDDGTSLRGVEITTEHMEQALRMIRSLADQASLFPTGRALMAAFRADYMNGYGRRGGS
jgi:hypothetical protein